MLEELRQKVEQGSNIQRRFYKLILILYIIIQAFFLPLIIFKSLNIGVVALLVALGLMSFIMLLGAIIILVNEDYDYADCKERLQLWQKIAASEDEKVKAIYREFLELEEKSNAPELLRKERNAKAAFLESLVK